MLRRLVAALVLLLLSLPAWGAGSVDLSTVITGESGIATNTMTISSVGSPSDADSHSILGVCIDVTGLDTSYSVSSVVWNGHSLLEAVSKQVAGAQPTASYWYLRSPEPSGFDDVVVTFSENILSAVGHAYVMKGLKDAAPEATGTAEETGSTDITGSVTTATANAFVVDCLSHNQSSGFVDPSPTASGQSTIASSEATNSGLGSPVGIGSSAQGAGSPGARTMSWTDLDETSASAALAMIAFAAAPTAAVKDPIGLGIVPAPR